MMAMVVVMMMMTGVNHHDNLRRRRKRCCEAREEHYSKPELFHIVIMVRSNVKCRAVLIYKYECCPFI